MNKIFAACKIDESKFEYLENQLESLGLNFSNIYEYSAEEIRAIANQVEFTALWKARFCTQCANLKKSAQYFCRLNVEDPKDEKHFVNIIVYLYLRFQNEELEGEEEDLETILNNSLFKSCYGLKVFPGNIATVTNNAFNSTVELAMFCKSIEPTRIEHKFAKSLLDDVDDEKETTPTKNERNYLKVTLPGEKHTISLTLQKFKPKDWKFNVSSSTLPPIGSIVVRGPNMDKDFMIDDNGFGIVIGHYSWDQDGNIDSVKVYWNKTKRVGIHRHGAENAMDIILKPHNMDHIHDGSSNPITCPSSQHKKESNNATYCTKCNLCFDCAANYYPACIDPDMGSISHRIPCNSLCDSYLIKCTLASPYLEGIKKVHCNSCNKTIKKDNPFFHCLCKKINEHPSGYQLCYNCGEKQKMNDLKCFNRNCPLVIAAIGPTGSGKSSLCNTICGSSFFRNSSTMSAGTTKVRATFCKWMQEENSPWITIVDTPGLSDLYQRDEGFLKEMVDFFEKIICGINAFLFVMNGLHPRGSDHLIKVFEFFNAKLGEKFWNHVILIYTKCDEKATAIWHPYVRSHEEFAQELRKKFQFKTELLDVIHLSNDENRNFDKLLELIKQKSRFTPDFLLRASATKLQNMSKQNVEQIGKNKIIQTITEDNFCNVL